MGGDNLKQKSMIKSVLTSEVKYVIGIIVFITGVVAPYYTIRQDIALIQKDISIINTNHETHIQDIITELQKMKEDENTIEKELAITNQVLMDHLNIKR
jgi:hypothetical protein